MQHVSLIIFILQGFIISRLIAKGNLISYSFFKIFQHKKISLKKLLLISMAITGCLSSLISNVTTVILLLPFLKKLNQTFQKTHPQKYLLLMTIFPISIAYSANIASISSVIATPTNLILLTFLEWHQIHLPYMLSFVGWLLWGIPLTILLICGTWLLLQTYISKQGDLNIKDLINQQKVKLLHIDKITIKVILIYLISTLVISTGINYLPHWKPIWLVISILYFLFSLMYVFLIPIKINSNIKTRLLHISDCFSDLPIKAFVFISIMITIIGVGYLINLHIIINTFITPYYEIIQEQPFLFLLICTLFVSFGTEVLLNSSILLAMFSIIGTLYTSNQISNELLISASIAITLSSNCAFISPIATGSNSFAFSMIPKIKRQSKIFIPIGIFTNLFIAVIIACFCNYLVPRLI